MINKTVATSKSFWVIFVGLIILLFYVIFRFHVTQIDDSSFYLGAYSGILCWHIGGLFRVEKSS